MNTINTRFLFRELRHGWSHSLLFIVCLALSLSAIGALNNFEGAVNRALKKDARILHGADLTVHSHYPLSQRIIDTVDELEKKGFIISSRVYRFYTIIRDPKQEKTLFSNIKIVGPEFPLYGDVTLQSGRSLRDSLISGKTVVAEDVLKRLNLQLGDTLYVGSSELIISDIIVHETDSPVNILNFGPRIFIAEADVEELDLIKKGSRVAHELLIKQVDGTTELVDLKKRLASSIDPAQERVNSYLDAESGLQRFFDNLLFFLSLISVFTLFLAGIGMQSCLKALFHQKKKTIAISRTMGATAKFLYTHYILLISLLGIVGILFGITCGSLIGLYLPKLFEGLLPVSHVGGVHFSDLAEGVVLGSIVVALFTFLPLFSLKDIKPIAIFRHENSRVRKTLSYYLIVGCAALFAVILVLKQLEDKAIGLMFICGLVVLIIISGGLAQLFLFLLKKMRIKRLTIRQAARSITRSGNSSKSIIITMVSALSLIFTIFLLDSNLRSTYIQSYPDDAPTLFCLDIQRDQRSGFKSLFDDSPELFPVIRARLLAINNEKINRQDELRKKRDNFAREFNLTYRDELLEDEIIKEGEDLFPARENDRPLLQVSVLDSIATMGNLKMGDELLFNIQGVELKAEITSIRGRTKSRLYPFFYFVFPTEFLQAAPQTFFTAMHIEKEEIAGVQNDVLNKYPNISFVNVAETAKDIGVLLRKISRIINFFAVFSIAAGGLIIINSILATRMERMRESVYYKILGGNSSFVYSVFIWENTLLGLICGAIALCFGQIINMLLCHFIFEIEPFMNITASLILLVMTVFFVVLTGVLSSLTTIRQKPGKYLREYGNG